MRVDALIAILQKYYKPEDHVAYRIFDRNIVENFYLDRTFTDEQWVAFAEAYNEAETNAEWEAQNMNAVIENDLNDFEEEN
jgi:hypothetical protein